jgi:hypothetical protein
MFSISTKVVVSVLRESARAARLAAKGNGLRPVFMGGIFPKGCSCPRPSRSVVSQRCATGTDSG